MKRLRLCFLLGLGVAGFVTALAVTGVSEATSAAKSFSASVTRIVDGDTIVVTYGGRTDRVRVLGIDAPEKGRCYANQATAEARRLAGGKQVRLVGDSSQAIRDRYGRLLAYVMAPVGDVGQRLESWHSIVAPVEQLAE